MKGNKDANGLLVGEETPCKGCVEEDQERCAIVHPPHLSWFHPLQITYLAISAVASLKQLSSIETDVFWTT